MLTLEQLVANVCAAASCWIVGPSTAGHTRPLGATGCSGGTCNELSYYRAYFNTYIVITESGRCMRGG